MTALAEDPASREIAAEHAAATGDVSGGRYFGGLLDRRSIYGKYWFPEPLLNSEVDVDREIRLDYLHTEKRGRQSNNLRAEVEYAVGLLTLEVEVPYVNDRDTVRDGVTGRATHERSEGLANIELAVRHPIYQYVSADEKFDYSLVAALEIAVPTKTRISHDTEIVPELFQAIRIGEHFSVQTNLGLSYLIGPVDGGSQTLEYGAALGYSIDREQLHLPGIVRLTPLLEIRGERGMNRGANGQSIVNGVLGARIDLHSLGPVQPRLGIGYVFPIDKGARNESNWGIVTSIVFEY